MGDVGMGADETEAVGQEKIVRNVLGPEQVNAVDRWVAEMVVRTLRDRRGEDDDERL